MDRANGSTQHPPWLDADTDYAAWKAKMRAFLWAQDEKVWSAVEEGWKQPTKEVIVSAKVIAGEETSTSKKLILKPKNEWTVDESTSSTYNQKGLNAIFTSVSRDQFNLISHCRTSKDAWDVLEATHEGDAHVRASRLQNLITEFENIKMSDNEKFSDFYGRLNEIVNNCENLGDPFPEHRVVKKILRSLPMTYHTKKTAIEESKNLNTYKLADLLGNLKTYEMEFPSSKKSKGIALSVVNEVLEKELDDNMSQEQRACVVEQFRNFLKEKYLKGSEKQSLESSSKASRAKEPLYENPMKSFKNPDNKFTKEKIKCFECGGSGHISSECANTLKRKKFRHQKAMNVTWSDSESESESCSENESICLALTGRLEEVLDDSDCEEPSKEMVMEQYADLFDESEIMRNKILFLKTEQSRIETDFQSQLKNGEKLRLSLLEKMQDLQEQVQGQKELVVIITNERDDLLEKLNASNQKNFLTGSGTETLNKMLNSGKRVGDTRGLGFIGVKNAYASSNSSIRFVKATNVLASVDVTKFIPTCHHCGVSGHIRPRCNKFRKENEVLHKKFVNSEIRTLRHKLETCLKDANRISRIISVPSSAAPTLKQVWRRKENQKCLFSCSSLQTTNDLVEGKVVTSELTPPKLDLGDLYTIASHNSYFKPLNNSIGVSAFD